MRASSDYEFHVKVTKLLEYARFVNGLMEKSIIHNTAARGKVFLLGGVLTAKCAMN
jgi:hypothetical protein